MAIGLVLNHLFSLVPIIQAVGYMKANVVYIVYLHCSLTVFFRFTDVDGAKAKVRNLSRCFLP